MWCYCFESWTRLLFMLRHSHKGHITSPLPFCSCCDTLNRCQICLVIPCLCAFGNTSKYFLVRRGSAAKVSYFSFFEKGICLCVLSVIAKILKFFIMCLVSKPPFSFFSRNLVFSSGEENDFNLQWIKVDSIGVLVSSPPRMLVLFSPSEQSRLLASESVDKAKMFSLCGVDDFNAWCIVFIYLFACLFFGTSFGPIEYKGPMSAVYIEKFVRRVMKPLLYIPSQSELLDFLSNYEVPFFLISSVPETFYLVELDCLY